MLLTARNLSKHFGPRLLFSDITVGLEAGQRVGLIGPNGSGKSTLLKIFAGLEHPDEGELIARRNLRVGYVPQEESFEAGRACVDIVADGADPHLPDHDRHLAASVLLGRLGFEDPSTSATTLSGGWRKRLSIARQLIIEPELLLMDEPTNHLDLDGVLWLEKLVARGQFATLIVTHDRRFLENVATRIIELDRRYPDGYLAIDGTYSQFLEKREAFLAAQQGRQQSLASGVRREIEWLQRGAKARTTKAKGRIERAEAMQSELADLMTRNTATGTAGIDFAGSGRRTRKLIELKDVARRFGDLTLFEHVDLTLSPGDRLGLIGSNGTGKTSLIRLLSGEHQPDAGTIKRADDLKVIVFDQHREQLDLDQTLRRALFPSGDTLQVHGTPTHVAGWAKRFLFKAEQLDVPLRDLSGGERARVLIARLMLREVDVLILDEPTNDLDIPTLDVLEASIENFDGAVVLVTHDRYLLDRVATSLLALDGRGNTKEFASLAQWERARTAQLRSDADAKRAATSAPAGKTSSPPARKRLTWAEQRELEKMEASILAAEALVEQLQAQAADPAIAADHVRGAEVYHQLTDAQHEVERLYARWGELEERSA